MLLELALAEGIGVRIADPPGEGRAVGRSNRRTIIKGALGALGAYGGTRRGTDVRAAPVVSLPPHRPLDFRPFEEALSGLTPETRCRLDAIVLEATAPQLQAD